MNARRALAAAISAALTAALIGAAPAQPAARALVTLRANVPISAAPGWFAWSVKRPDGWRLVTRHGGRKPRVQAVAPRRTPFDVDLGTDVSGAIVATYSRCATRRVAGSTALVDCRLRVLDLATGTERDAGIKTPDRASDRSPSMWMGRIAFARDVAGDQPDVDHLLLATPGQGDPVDLGTGPLAGECQGLGCPTAVDPETVGSIDRVDLGASHAAYLWTWAGGDAIGHAETEVVVADASGRGSLVAGFGFYGEKCADDIVDTVALNSPVIHRGRVLHAQWESECYAVRSSLGRLLTDSRKRFTGTVPGVLLQIASDGRFLYGLFAKRPRDEFDPSCSSRDPCVLRRLTPPRYRPVDGVAEPPLLTPRPAVPARR